MTKAERLPVGLAPARLGKFDNFLPGELASDIVFQKLRQATGASRKRRAIKASAFRTRNDSELAPQAIEIARNGLEKQTGKQESRPALRTRLVDETEEAKKLRKSARKLLQ